MIVAASAPCGRTFGGMQGKQPLATGDIGRVEHMHAAAESRGSGFGGLQGPRDGARNADVDDLLMMAQQELEHASKVARRRLRRAHRMLAGAQQRRRTRAADRDTLSR